MSMSDWRRQPTLSLFKVGVVMSNKAKNRFELMIILYRKWCFFCGLLFVLLMSACASRDAIYPVGEVSSDKQRLVVDENATVEEMLRAAAAAGNARSALELGRLYISGEYGVAVDDGEALRWLEKGWSLGDRSEAALTGVLAMRLAQVPEDYHNAERYLREALEGDLGEAYPAINRMLGISLSASGRSGGKQESIPYLTEAAVHGDTQAALALYALYDSGIGVMRDRQKALYWVSLAARAGNGIGLARYARSLAGEYRDDWSDERVIENLRQIYFVALHASAVGYREEVQSVLSMSQRALAIYNSDFPSMVEQEAREWAPGTPFPWQR